MIARSKVISLNFRSGYLLDCFHGLTMVLLQRPERYDTVFILDKFKLSVNPYLY